MAKSQCYGCQEYGNYKRDCPKIKKDKRGKKEAQIIEKVEEIEKKKSKNEEVRDIYFD